MRLSANLIVNYANINQFSYANQWQIRAGDTNTLYFQIVDLDQNINNMSGLNSGAQNLNGPSSSLRYLVGLGTQNQPYAVQVKFPSIDDSKALVVQAVQASSNDSSVWMVSIAGTQCINSGNVIFTVFEGTSIRTFKLMNALAVEYPGTDGSC